MNAKSISPYSFRSKFNIPSQTTYKFTKNLLNFTELSSIQTEKGRFYLSPVTNEYYPSVTTVLSSISNESLKNWRLKIGEDEAEKITNIATSRGSKVHKFIENCLLGQPNPIFDPQTSILGKQIMDVLENNLGEINGIECPLISDRLKIAGRCDLIGYFDGKLSIIDFKTSSKEKSKEYIKSYFLQETCYSMMFKDMGLGYIEQIVTIIASIDNMCPQIFIENIQQYVDDCNKIIYNYHNMK